MTTEFDTYLEGAAKAALISYLLSGIMHMPQINLLLEKLELPTTIEFETLPTFERIAALRKFGLTAPKTAEILNVSINTVHQYRTAIKKAKGDADSERE